MLPELLALIAPPRCALCADPCPTRARLCARCECALTHLTPTTSSLPGLDATWSAAAYEGLGRELVAALKFAGRLGLAANAAAAIAAHAPAELLTGTIVPVPSAPMRRRQRGFDAAEAIALALAGQTGLPYEPCLVRTQGRRQVGRPRAARMADPPRIRVASHVPERALLVDDVMTTGATLGACARALRTGGALGVVALTFARSRPAWGRLGEARSAA